MRINYGTSSHRVDTTPPVVNAPPFSPTEMTSLFGWWDPTQGVTTVSGAVSQWVDAAFGATVSQGTAANRPTFSATAINGSPGLTMDQTAAHVLTGVSLLEPVNLTMVTIAAVTLPVGAATFISGSAASVIQFRINSGAKLDIVKQQNVDIANSVGTVTSGSLAIIVMWTSTSATSYGFRLNGTADSSSTNASATYASGQTISFFQNISAGGTTETYSGTIGDIILCSAVSSTLDIQKAEGYLAWKYSVTSLLPSGHPYKSVRP